jgi:signal transduction histidine kinase
VGLLATTSRRAERLARQQMEFVAGISHELRTPVAVIRSAAENLSQGVVASGDRVKRYGEMIETEARRLGDMVERVLLYAGIESGLAWPRAPLAPAGVIDGAIERWPPPEARIERVAAPDLPVVVGDAAALRSAAEPDRQRGELRQPRQVGGRSRGRGGATPGRDPHHRGGSRAGHSGRRSAPH